MQGFLTHDHKLIMDFIWTGTNIFVPPIYLYRNIYIWRLCFRSKTLLKTIKIPTAHIFSEAKYSISAGAVSFSIKIIGFSGKRKKGKYVFHNSLFFAFHRETFDFLEKLIVRPERT
jgi:hypothetical protein